MERSGLNSDLQTSGQSSTKVTIACLVKKTYVSKSKRTKEAYLVHDKNQTIAMNVTDEFIPGSSINGTEPTILPYVYSAFNTTTLAFSSSATTASAMTAATERLVEIFNITHTDDTPLRKNPGAVFRGALYGRRGSPRMSENSPLQICSKHVRDKVSFYFPVVLIPLFSLFGSIGNVLSLRVLVNHRMRNATYMVLAALAVSDLLFLLHAFYFSFLKFYIIRNPEAGKKLKDMTFPILGAYCSVVTARITTGLTTMLSVERLIAVYFPMKAKAMCGRVMTITFIIMIYLVTALVFIPNALKYHSYYETVNNQTHYVMRPTELGKNKLFYLIYGNILNGLFRFIPLLVLILVNILIVLAIRRTWSFRRAMSGGRSARYEQNRITLMLLMVSMVFLVCIMPGAIHSIMSKIYKEYASRGVQSNIHDVMRNVTYFLETVNSSVNFVIYMLFSKKFNRTYKELFHCSRVRNATRTSVRSVIRFPSRPQTGSRSSLTSYRELYLLNQMGKGNLGNGRDRNFNGMPVRKNGCVASTGMILEEDGKKIFRSKYSISESYSGHSHSHSHSQSGHSSSQGKGERYSQHSVHSIHSNHSIEPTAEDKYS